MPTIKLTTLIHATPERVFDLARSIDAHVASTSKTQERAVAGRVEGLIEMGEEVTWEARHFGIRQQLRVQITAFHRPVMFVDEMISRAFSMMVHTHRFEVDDRGTIMIDQLEFRAPLGILGRVVEKAFLTRYMRAFLIERNRFLKQSAESGDSFPGVPD
jgi:ligand-binding SRPBCC domain-containing protein